MGWSIETIAWVERANHKRKAYERFLDVETFSAAQGNKPVLLEIIAEAFGLKTAALVDLKMQFDGKD